MKYNIILGVAFVLAVAALGAYFFGFKEEPLKGARIRIGEQEFLVEVADTAAARAQGLSGREILPENGGMVFLFGKPGPYGIWMKDMRFPIDIVWVRDGKVVGVTERVSPEPGKSIFELTVYSPPEDADMIIELVAGARERYSIEPGERVIFLPN